MPPSAWNPPGRSPVSVPESCLATFSAHLCASEFSWSLHQETAFKAPPRQVVAPAMQETPETRVPSLGRGDPLETGMTTPPILAGRISMNRGAWRAAVRGVAKSRTPLTERARPPCLSEAFPVSSAPLTPERGGRTQPSFAGSQPRKVLPRRRPGFQTTRVNQTLDAPGKADDARRRCARGPGLDPNARQLCVRPSLASGSLRPAAPEGAWAGCQGATRTPASPPCGARTLRAGFARSADIEPRKVPPPRLRAAAGQTQDSCRGNPF